MYIYTYIQCCIFSNLSHIPPCNGRKCLLSFTEKIVNIYSTFELALVISR